MLLKRLLLWGQNNDVCNIRINLCSLLKIGYGGYRRDYLQDTVHIVLEISM